MKAVDMANARLGTLIDALIGAAHGFGARARFGPKTQPAGWLEA